MKSIKELEADVQDIEARLQAEGVTALKGYERMKAWMLQWWIPIRLTHAYVWKELLAVEVVGGLMLLFFVPWWGAALTVVVFEVLICLISVLITKFLHAA